MTHQNPAAQPAPASVGRLDETAVRAGQDFDRAAVPLERRVMRRGGDKVKTTNVDAWLKSGEYLPDVLRDFHDQKDIFKAMHEAVDVEGHDYCKSVSWIAGQCYVIDIFLWWMARRGYTLQRTRRRGDFRDLGSDVRELTEARNAAMAKAMGLTPHNLQVQRDSGSLIAEGSAGTTGSAAGGKE